MYPFCQVFCENYPENLKTLILYPFPWYGVTVWNYFKVFIDQRLQDKLVFVAKDYSSNSSGQDLPEEIIDVIEAEQIPTVCGGKNNGSVMNLRKIFE